MKIVEIVKVQGDMNVIFQQARSLAYLRDAIAKMPLAERQLIRQLFVGNQQANAFDAAFGDLLEPTGSLILTKSQEI